MRRVRLLALFCALILLLSTVSCQRTELHTSRVYAMGTYCSLTEALSKGEDGDSSPLFVSLLGECEALLSHRLDGSVPNLLNTLGYASVTDERLLDALRLAEELRIKTDGRFSVLLLPLTDLWNFDAQSPVPPTEEALNAALAKVADSTVSFCDGTVRAQGVDLGAIGKGYACDVVADALCAKGKSALVSVGGSLAAIGAKPSGKPWQIGVRDPFSASANTTLGTLSLTDAFVSTSGSYEKCFTYEGVTYHHILDPKTGKPLDSDLVSVTVIAETGVLSDMLSTACFSVGSDGAFALASEYGASILAVKTDGTLLVSASLKGVFTPNAGWEASYR